MTSRHYAKRGTRVNLADLLALLRALGADGAPLTEMQAATGRSRAAVMRLLADAGLLGVRIEWRGKTRRYHVTEWGMLRQQAFAPSAAGASHPWPVEHDELVRDTSLSLPEVARLTGRSLSAVNMRAARLGVRRDTRRRWTADEIDTLRDTSLTLREVARRTGRTLRTVVSKAERMGVSRRSSGKD